jgi:hypothetical protein
MSISTDASRLDPSQAPPLHSDITWGTGVVPWVPIAITWARPWDTFCLTPAGTRDIYCPSVFHPLITYYLRPWISRALLWHGGAHPLLAHYACTIWVCKSPVSLAPEKGAVHGPSMLQ